MVQQLTTEQRTFVVTKYLETKSIKSVQDQFRQRFSNRNALARRTIQQNVLKYKRHGTSLSRNKGNRSVTVTPPDDLPTLRKRIVDAVN